VLLIAVLNNVGLIARRINSQLLNVTACGQALLALANEVEIILRRWRITFSEITGDNLPGCGKQASIRSASPREFISSAMDNNPARVLRLSLA
jgi:hypothetical protein